MQTARAALSVGVWFGVRLNASQFAAVRWSSLRFVRPSGASADGPTLDTGYRVGQCGPKWTNASKSWPILANMGPWNTEFGLWNYFVQLRPIVFFLVELYLIFPFSFKFRHM